MEALQALVASPEWAAVKAAVLALDPALSAWDSPVGAHLTAPRTGLLATEQYTPVVMPESEDEVK
jgi:hypothetical protein